MNTEKNDGLLIGLLAMVLWGLLPLYWNLLDKVPADMILFHRIIWSAIFLVLTLLFRKKLLNTLSLLKDKRTLLTFILSSFAITITWYIYIWAVNNGFITLVGLAYYITPIISVSLGVMFFNEKMTSIQKMGIMFAIVGVMVKAFNTEMSEVKGVILCLIMAICQALYGILKKTQKNIAPFGGITLETVIIFPIALVFLIYGSSGDISAFEGNDGNNYTFLLLLSGPATAIPLILFSSSALKISVSLLGLMQYIPSTITIVIGIISGEKLDIPTIITIVLIWIGITLFSLPKKKQKI